MNHAFVFFKSIGRLAAPVELQFAQSYDSDLREVDRKVLQKRAVKSLARALPYCTR